jgi:tripartite-type tricarboxylate transporter receptor subunit TctC
MIHLTRRQTLAGALAAPFALAGRASAAAWPEGQTIHVVVGFAPGGSTDAIARLTQEGLQRRLGANIIVDNRPGGDSAIGAGLVARAAPDGLTWLNVFDSHAALSALHKLPFDIDKDLQPVMLIGVTPMVVACAPSKPYRTFADVVAAAKAKPETVTFASIGNGSLGHLGMTLLEKKGDFKMTHVPYNGGGPSMNAARGGQVDLIIGSAALVSPQVAAGGLRPLLQTGDERLPNLKDTPTAKDAGFPDFVALSWWGVWAPAKTPKEMVERYAKELAATLADESVAKTLRESQQVKILARGPEEFGKFFREQESIWGGVVRDNGIKAD